MIGKNTARHPTAEADVNLAVEMNYKYAIDNESEDVEPQNTEN